MKKTFSIISIALALMVVMAGGAYAAIINVPLGGSIQAAIDSANPGDTIQLASGTYTEAGIDVNKNVIIKGDSGGNTVIQAAATLGGASDRVFTVASGTTVEMWDLTVQNGSPDGTDGAAGTAGTAGGNGGGIYNAGDLTLHNVSVTNNRAGNGGDGGDGNNGNNGIAGADGADGASNTAPGGNGEDGDNGGDGGNGFAGQAGGAGGAGGNGGGIYNASTGTLTLWDSTVANNSAGAGGVGGDGGTGGNGGKGGNGGDGGDGSALPFAPGTGGDGGNTGNGGDAGAGGIGGNGGDAGSGGGIYNDGGTVILHNSDQNMTGNSVKSAGTGGTGGTAGISGPAGDLVGQGGAGFTPGVDGTLGSSGNTASDGADGSNGDAGWGAVIACPLGMSSPCLGDAGLYVSLAYFNATADADQEVVNLEWLTLSESDNAGFHIMRSDSADGIYYKITNYLIPSEGNEYTGALYTYTDEDVELGNTYYYKLADIDYSGKTTYHGPVAVTVE